jgi:hypothetical protein
MVNRPKLYKTEDYVIETEEGPETITLRGYRPVDIDITNQLQILKNEIIPLALQANVFKKVQKKLELKAKNGRDVDEKELMKLLGEIDKNISPKDFDNLMEINKKVQALQAEVEKLNAQLAIRGLKRWFYRDEDDFIKAEAENRTTEYIDAIPDREVETEPWILRDIATIMMRLGEPPKHLTKTGDDTGKP